MTPEAVAVETLQTQADQTNWEERFTSLAHRKRSIDRRRPIPGYETR
jgi:hypothetical protein